ncbi:MAG: trehalose-phosphatase [Acidobacteria bacterium]|nr:trehalose-phosphatase [Acidobacteriota bacterium]
MADILAKSHLPVLAAFASSNVLLAFDYDGTLAPIVPMPSRARMRRETRQLLTRVAGRYPCVVISGRRLDDVTMRLNGIPVWYVFGNFGHEPARQGERSSRAVRNWMHRLTERLPTHRGLVIEEKKYSVTIHYRHVRDKRGALAAIDDAVRDLQDARILGGSHAVNLLPQGGPDKGVALQQARRLFFCETAIYVGDDATDEDAFMSARPDRLLAIRVGAASASHARFRLKRQAEIDELLRTLLELRRPRCDQSTRSRPKKKRRV